jgi:probable phosphoglycerate mutase
MDPHQPPRTLILIRHGENDVMRTRLAGRLPGVHLNERGRQQAVHLASRLQHLPITAIYSSPLERAVQTAEPLAAARRLPIQIATGLLEVDYGDWQGLTYRQLRRFKLWKVVQDTPAAVRFPGGETLAEVQQRVLAEIDCRLKDGGLIACVAHGDIVRLALVHYLGMEINHFQRLAVAPASVSIVSLHENRPLVWCVNSLASFDLPSEPKPKKGRRRGG